MFERIAKKIWCKFRGTFKNGNSFQNLIKEVWTTAQMSKYKQGEKDQPLAC